MIKKMQNRKWLLALVPAVMLFTAGFVARPAAGDDYFEISKNLDIFGKLYREVHSNYVDDIEPTDFMRTGIDAMLKSLDPYTNYISAAEIEDYRFMSTGQYGGIGAMVGKRDNKVIVTEPYENSPAVKAGLRAGDVIIQIGDLLIKDMETYMDALGKFEKGQTVPVKLIRAEKEMTVNVTF